MIIHTARHGQPSAAELSVDDPEMPHADPALTALGRRQARLLGDFLKKEKFDGIIYSSPYRRTLETAQIAADILDCSILLAAELQEWVPYEGYPDFCGLDLEKIRRLYPRLDDAAELAYPWFVKGPETRLEIKKRVGVFLEKLLQNVKRDVLIVGHGASVCACKNILLPADVSKRHVWNCSISSYKMETKEIFEPIRLFDAGHMPDDCVTSNANTMAELKSGV